MIFVSALREHDETGDPMALDMLISTERAIKICWYPRMRQ